MMIVVFCVLVPLMLALIVFSAIALGSLADPMQCPLPQNLKHLP